MSHHEALWRRLPGIVWSNPEASDQVRIANALLRPYFYELLEIAAVLGLDTVEREWEALVAEASPEMERARPIVERILRNIREGFRIGAARH